MAANHDWCAAHILLLRQIARGFLILLLACGCVACIEKRPGIEGLAFAVLWGAALTGTTAGWLGRAYASSLDVAALERVYAWIQDCSLHALAAVTLAMLAFFSRSPILEWAVVPLLVLSGIELYALHHGKSGGRLRQVPRALVRSLLRFAVGNVVLLAVCLVLMALT